MISRCRSSAYSYKAAMRCNKTSHHAASASALPTTSPPFPDPFSSPSSWQKRKYPGSCPRSEMSMMCPRLLLLLLLLLQLYDGTARIPVSTARSRRRCASAMVGLPCPGKRANVVDHGHCRVKAWGGFRRGVPCWPNGSSVMGPRHTAVSVAVAVSTPNAVSRAMSYAGLSGRPCARAWRSAMSMALARKAQMFLLSSRNRTQWDCCLMAALVGDTCNLPSANARRRVGSRSCAAGVSMSPGLNFKLRSFRSSCTDPSGRISAEFREFGPSGSGSREYWVCADVPSGILGS